MGGGPTRILKLRGVRVFNVGKLPRTGGEGWHLSEGVAGRVLKPKQGRGVGRGSGQESNPGWGIRAQVGRGRSVRKGGPVQHAG